MLSNAEYPVRYEAEYVEERNRLTVFFRPFLLIPHALYFAVLGIALFVTIVVAWFALLFTNRYPGGLYSFNASVLQMMARVSAYALLQTDRFPGFGLGDRVDYPVHLRVPPPAESYTRWKTFLRYFLNIPFSLVSQAYLLVSCVFAIGTWFSAVFTGRSPESFHRFINWGLASSARVTAYGTFLLTEEWPPFEPDSGGLPPGPPAPQALDHPEAP